VFIFFTANAEFIKELSSASDQLFESSFVYVTYFTYTRSETPEIAV